MTNDIELNTAKSIYSNNVDNKKENSQVINIRTEKVNQRLYFCLDDIIKIITTKDYNYGKKYFNSYVLSYKRRGSLSFISSLDTAYILKHFVSKYVVSKKQAELFEYLSNTYGLTNEAEIIGVNELNKIYSCLYKYFKKLSYKNDEERQQKLKLAKETIEKYNIKSTTYEEMIAYYKVLKKDNILQSTKMSTEQTIQEKMREIESQMPMNNIYDTTKINNENQYSNQTMGPSESVDIVLKTIVDETTTLEDTKEEIIENKTLIELEEAFLRLRKIIEVLPVKIYTEESFGLFKIEIKL